MNRSKEKERWIHCYNSSQKILLVGEGDFSFSACLARAFHTAENIVATTYLKRKSLLKKHWTSIPHLEELERLGCLLFYKVDVYKMHTHPTLKNMKFDVIIFNFPHAGHYDCLCERDPELIEMHMALVEAYFKSASKMLTNGGEVHLRHREDPPYDRWNVVLLAGNAGLTLKEKVDFSKSDYPGYHNKRGGGINTNKAFPIRCAYTYKFSPYLPKVVNHHYYYLFKKDVVHDDKIQVLCGKDTVYDHVNNKFQKDEVDVDLLVQKKDEVHLLKNGSADVDLPNIDIVVNDLDLHVLEMVDVCQQCSKSDKVGDDLMKKDYQVHFDLELLKVIDHDDLLKKDKINADLDLQKVVDDCQMNIEIQKLDKKDLKSEDDLGDDHDFPKKGELYVLEMKQDLYQQRSKKDKVHEHHQDLLKKDDKVHYQDLDQQQNKNEEVHDHFLKSEEMDSDLPNNGVNDAYFPKNDLRGVDNNLDVCVQEMEDDVLEESDVDVDIKEMKDEMERVHGDLYARVLEMMDHLQDIKNW